MGVGTSTVSSATNLAEGSEGGAPLPEKEDGLLLEFEFGTGEEGSEQSKEVDWETLPKLEEQPREPSRDESEPVKSSKPIEAGEKISEASLEEHWSKENPFGKPAVETRKPVSLVKDYVTPDHLRKPKGHYPKPPMDFRKDTPIHYPFVVQKNLLTRVLQKDKPRESPAPFMPGTITDEILPNEDRRASFLPNKAGQAQDSRNPFIVDTSESPFRPGKPTFFHQPGEDPMERISPPPRVLAVQPKDWDEMTGEEQAEFYFERRQDYLDYLEDSFSIRMESKMLEECKEEFDNYERCLGVKDMWIGWTKWSSLRGVMRQMYTCIPQLEEMTKCSERVDNERAEVVLREEDQTNIKKYFPK